MRDAEGVPVLLYLVQHGKAETEEDDPQRPLTDLGFMETERTAAYVARHIGVAPSRILHSGKLRAQETADIFTEALRPKEGDGAVDGLLPNDDPHIWAERLVSHEADLMLVGHLPHLGRLAALLLAGDPDREVVWFVNSGIVVLRRNDSGAWSLLWAVPPQMAD